MSARSIIIVFTGLPGSGKGVQSALLAKKFSIPHITPGFWLRTRAKVDPEINEYITRGAMVPDHITNEMMEQALIDSNFTGAIDGYPRTIGHAISLDNFLKLREKKISAVIHLQVSQNVAISRLGLRHMCYQCNSSFTKQVTCCGIPTERRVDDEHHLLEQRIKIHRELYTPIEEFYSRNNTNYISVNGEQSAQQTFADILVQLENRGISI